MIRYFINKEIDSKVNQWAIEFLLQSAGFKAVKIKELNADVNLYYGNDEIEFKSLSEALIIKNDYNISVEELNIDITELTYLNEINYDIIYATKLFLTDQIHSDLEIADFDIHNRLNYNSSFQHKNEIGNIPLLNYYVSILRNTIQKKFNIAPIPSLPKNYKSVVILSHDVDEPYRYAIFKDFNKRLKILSLKNKFKYCWLSFRKKARCMLFKGKNSYLNFEKIIAVEAKYGFSSTFFFTAKSKFDKNSDFTYDNSYDIAWKEFEDIFECLNENGFEIGLHSTYNSHKEKAFFIIEKGKLEIHAKRTISGNRQHFWNLGSNPEKTLLKHQQAGLEYDSSIAFNDSPGYRNNVALPYYPFNSQNNKSLKTLQIPNFIMDTNLIKETVNEEQVLEKAIKLIEVLEKSKGIAAINWHVRMAYPNDPKLAIYGKTYLNILSYLSKKEAIWVTSFEKYMKWHKQREKQLNDLA